MRNFYGIGFVLGLSFVFGNTVANAQGGGTGGTGQVGGAAPGAPAGAGDTSGQGDEFAEPVPKKPAPPPRNRMSTFGRVTTTRKEVVPAQSQGGRVGRPGGASSGAAAGSRAAVMHPYAAQAANARSRAANNSGVPSSSTWQQERPRPTRPPATATRSVTHNFYPNLRQGRGANTNIAKVARGKSRVPGMGMGGMGAGGMGGGGMGMGGMGMGSAMGLGMGMVGARAGQNGNAARGNSSPQPRR